MACAAGLDLDLDLGLEEEDERYCCRRAVGRNLRSTSRVDFRGLTKERGCILVVWAALGLECGVCLGVGGSLLCVVDLVVEEIGSAKVMFVVSWLVFAMVEGSVYIVRCWTVKWIRRWHIELRCSSLLKQYSEVRRWTLRNGTHQDSLSP